MTRYIDGVKNRVNSGAFADLYVAVTYNGSGWNTYNRSHYLYNGNNWWTLSPVTYYGDYDYSERLNRAYAYQLGVTLSSDEVNDNYYSYSSAVRPAISLKSGTQIVSGGDGRVDNPYVISVR